MIVEGAEEQPGQLISGLKSSAEVRKIFKTAGWNTERAMVRELL
jgi:hypothetical protein